MDVHVQKAPVSGTVTYLKHVPEEFGGADRARPARHHENVLIGFNPAEAPSEPVSVRLIAGRITRRILPWVEQGEAIERSERIGMIQFGSRCDLYLPLTAKVHVEVGDKVKGGETIVASFV